jgi:medium-chain acyl-[acyl-carrier-protein] hydrolase
LHAVADELADAIAELDDLPYAIFGHSMGSWVGLEVVRRLEAMGRPPVRFFASGRQAPVLGCTQPRMAHLSDDEFLAEMQARYGGIPEEILAERELLELLLPSVRADIELLERHEHDPGRPVSIPVHAIVGDHDTVVAVEEMTPWADETAGDFRVTTLRGGHFYFQPDPAPLLSIVRRELKDVLERDRTSSRARAG